MLSIFNSLFSSQHTSLEFEVLIYASNPSSSSPSLSDQRACAARDLRVAEVVKQDIHLDEDGSITYRTKLQLSFKYEHEH